MGRSGRTDFSLDLLPALAAVPNLIAETAYNGGELVRDLVAALGAERVVFASDAPFNDLDLEIARIQRAGLAPDDLRAVFAGAARWLSVVAAR
jgi:predicted TIM-barrel fold metal-dependent hydrolase